MQSMVWSGVYHNKSFVKFEYMGLEYASTLMNGDCQISGCTSFSYFGREMLGLHASAQELWRLYHNKTFGIIKKTTLFWYGNLGVLPFRGVVLGVLLAIAAKKK